MAQEKGFAETSSIARSFTFAIFGITLLFLLQFAGIYLSSRSFLTGLSELHESQRLTAILSQLKLITDSIQGISGGKPVRPPVSAGERRVLSAAQAQAADRLSEARAVVAPDPALTGYLNHVESSLTTLETSTFRYLGAATVAQASREQLLSKQFALDVNEALDKMRLAVENHSNTVFRKIYLSRYRPLHVTMLLAASFMAFVLFGGMTLIRGLLASIENLIEAATRVSHGDFDTRAPILKKDEIGTLTFTFNEMTERLQRSTVSMQYVETIIDSMPSGLFVVGSDGRILRVNQRAIDRLGYPHDQLLGQPIKELFAEEVAGSRDWFAALAHGERIRNHEAIVRPRSGVPIPVSLSASVMPHGSGPGEIVCVVQDITELKQAEAERRWLEMSQRILSESTRILSESIDFGTTLQNVARAVASRFAECCIVRVSAGSGRAPAMAVSCFVPTDESVLRANFSDDSKNQAFEAAIEETMRTRQTRLIQAPLALLGGAALVSPIVYRDDLMGALISISSDSRRFSNIGSFELHQEIARRAGIAIENARLYREAQDAISSRDEFLSIASHELKTPLTSLSLQLQMFSRMLRRREAEGRAPAEGCLSVPRTAVELVSSCEAQSRRLAALLDELLDLTRIRLGKLQLAKESTDLGAVVEAVVRRFHVEAKQKSIELTVMAAPSVIGSWDPMRIDQVASNLISNAIKYGGGKPVSVSVEKDEHGKRAKLVVKDQGIGISPEMRTKVFERFERAGVSGTKIAGLGLGLYICRQIVEAHGGTIKVDSQVGVGSSFVVELPLANDDVRSPAVA